MRQGDGWLTVCGWRSVVEELVALHVVVEHGLADVALVVVARAVQRAVGPEHHAATTTEARTRVSGSPSPRRRLALRLGSWGTHSPACPKQSTGAVSSLISRNTLKYAALSSAGR